MDLPMFWDPELLDKDIHKVNFFPELQSRFGIIDRMASGDTIRWFEAEPCYIYHIVNSWEEGNEVVLDVCRMSTPVPSREVRQKLSGPYATMLAWLKLDACYHRYRFNLETGETKEERKEDLLINSLVERVKKDKIEEVQELRRKDLETLPSTISEELNINPFLRCNQNDVINSAESYCKTQLSESHEVLGAIREWKDNF